jgi:hypothetical protein
MQLVTGFSSLQPGNRKMRLTHCPCGVPPKGHVQGAHDHRRVRVLECLWCITGVVLDWDELLLDVDADMNVRPDTC